MTTAQLTSSYSAPSKGADEVSSATGSYTNRWDVTHDHAIGRLQKPIAVGFDF